jgi:hypothetical protein
MLTVYPLAVVSSVAVGSYRVVLTVGEKELSPLTPEGDRLPRRHDAIDAD